MKFNFFDVFKWMLYRKASNKIINTSIDEVQRLNANHKAKQVNDGYKLPNWWTIIKTLLTGWIYTVNYLFLASFFILFRCSTKTMNIFTIVYGLIISLLFFDITIYKKKEVPVYKPDARYSSGQRQIGTKVIDDKDTGLLLKGKYLYRKWICCLIIMAYFIFLGIPISNKFYSYIKEMDKTKTEQVKKIK